GAPRAGGGGWGAAGRVPPPPRGGGGGGGGGGGRGTLGGQHPLLLPVYLPPRLQLRAVLAAAIHHRLGGRGSLPSQRPDAGRGTAPLRHRPGRDRHARRLAGEQAARRLPDWHPERGDPCPPPFPAPPAPPAPPPPPALGARHPPP